HGESSPAREVVVLWGERLTAAPNAEGGARALLDIAAALSIDSTDGAGLLEVPAAANGRGLREAGVLPNVGPGLSQLPLAAGASPSGEVAGPVAYQDPRDARAIAQGLADGELNAVYLLQSDPLRELPDAELWEQALAGASTVIAHASFLTDAIREHADVVFPAEAYPEKEGTVVHPDGRLQRLRPAIARPGSVRAGWQVVSELALRLGLDLDVLSGAMASKQLFDAVPFYAGLTLEEIGGRGVRWQERDGASAFPSSDAVGPAETGPALAPISGDAAADAAGYRSVWDAVEVEHSPALEFLFHPADAVLPLSYSGGSGGGESQV
ncbi:MAG: molybdopterin-dependent oxidoreductase, partial [Solirubrobacteraceae bacterium]